MTSHRVGRGAGIALAHDYFGAVVAPLLSERCPDVRYAAARVGSGSEVLGLDDAMSRDHDWGLRLQLFVSQDAVRRVEATLRLHLPETFKDHPCRLTFTGQTAPRLGIEVTTVEQFAHEELGFDPVRSSPSVSDWLSVSGQAALEVTTGAVFADQVGDLSRLREALAWYPQDIWRYVVACDWHRIDQELPLLSRAGDRGDDLGSRLIGARLVDVIVHLAFMLCRTWPPYSKWRGTMFAQLPIADSIGHDLQAVLAAADWRSRTDTITAALEHIAEMQRQADLPTAEQPVVPFWDRPYIHIEPSLVPTIMGSIKDPAIRRLPVGLGSIDQRTDNVDLLVHPEHRRAATHL